MYLFSVFAQNKQKRSKGFINIRDHNQELLLSIPDLLTRLVNIATAKTCKLYKKWCCGSTVDMSLYQWHRCVTDKPRYPQMQSELDCWMEWIENTLADDAFENPGTDDLDDFIGGRRAFICRPVNSN